MKLRIHYTVRITPFWVVQWRYRDFTGHAEGIEWVTPEHEFALWLEAEVSGGNWVVVKQVERLVEIEAGLSPAYQSDL